MFHNEVDILECRLEELSPVVDRFVVIECGENHLGSKKGSNFDANRSRFDRWQHQIEYVWVETLHATDPRAREYEQRECIRDGLNRSRADANDIILQSDADEIPRRSSINNVVNSLSVPEPPRFVALEQSPHYFAVDWLYPRGGRTSVAGFLGSIESFWGMRQANANAPLIRNAGWHFSWLGGVPAHVQKIEAIHEGPEIAGFARPLIESGRFWREGIHVDGVKMAPIDVDETFPAFVRERRCPANWFRPRHDSVAVVRQANGRRDLPRCIKREESPYGESLNAILGVPVLYRYDLLERLIASAENGLAKPSRYLIVDNGGQLDEESPSIARAIERGAIVSVLYPERNLGVAASWNAILLEAAAEPVIVSNDDIVLGPKSLEQLRAALNQHDFVVADGGARATGWCLFAQNASCVARVGLYDENFYPAYFEDGDYKRRLTLAGIAPFLVPSDHTHEGWATLRWEKDGGPIHEGQQKNFEYYLRKWGGPPDAELFAEPFNGEPVDWRPKSRDDLWVNIEPQRHDGPLMRYDVVNQILKKLKLQRYLEIGVCDGEMMRRVNAPFRVGVDPAPQANAVSAATEFFSMPSDQFFAETSMEFDVVFIDGLHHADQAYRDIENACRCSKVVVAHDSSPYTEAMQIVPPIQGEWTGDVWKAIARIRTEGRHTVRTIDADYGVAVIIPNREEVVPTFPRETWGDLVAHRTELLGLLSPGEWEDWFDAAYAGTATPNRHQRRAARAKEKKQLNQDSQEPRVLLNMIVKNEGAIIERCLTAALPFIDSWVIADTGSTDGTGEAIETFFAKHRVPGKLVRTTFKNFAQARNESLNAAHAVGGWDYALLIDADMVLQGSLDKLLLTAPAYRILQRSSSLDYWNTRLVRRASPANYVGVTHEFLSVSEPHPPRLTGLTIDDHDDGGSKSDKGERDIRLLNEGLSTEPNNERYMFYLASTYREMGQHAEAIQWYRRRIQAGGWDEEVWAAYYGIARSYAALNDEPNLVHACFDAYNFRPTRAEPLSMLARYWREHSKSDAAILMAEQVARIPDQSDTLFVEREIYERKNEVDVAISGFYSKLQERKRVGYETCARLTIDRDAHIRNEARGNFVHYVKSAHELFGAKVQAIDWTPPNGYAPMNPSVLVVGDRRLVLVRTVNYKIADGQYPTTDGSGIIRTKNWIVEMDADWKPTQSTRMEDASGTPCNDFRVEGFEDCRLWHDGDRYFASTTVRNLCPELSTHCSFYGSCEMAVLSLDEQWRVAQVRPIRDYEHDKTQKNWMPILGRPNTFLYLCDPTIVIDCAPGGTVELSRVADMDQNLTEMRGGSQVIPHGDGWLCLVHEVVFTPARVYLHRFVKLNAEFVIQALSEPWYFTSKNIEFAAGLARDGDRLVASFGLNDASANLAFFDASTVDRLLT
jgi:glycosyltransferase involved in cell wall biosynthesis